MSGEQPLSLSERITCLEFTKLTSRAIFPTKATRFSAGYDLYSPYDYIIEPKGLVQVRTDIQVSLPKGAYGRIAARSSMALKHIAVGGGVIDRDYEGNVIVILFNHGDEPYEIYEGDRIGQFICERIASPEVYLTEPDRLVPTNGQAQPDTIRGAQGFGSSGV